MTPSPNMTLMNVSSHSIKNFLKLFLLPEISTWVILFLRRHSCTLSLSQYRATHPKKFRRNLRVSPTTFDALVSRIEGHQVFENRSNSQQFPVEIQLAIALFRFGHEGNAASVDAIAQWAGVSAGLVVKATRRVMIAVLSLHDSVIRWPTEEEKEEARQWVEQAACNGFLPCLARWILHGGWNTCFPCLRSLGITARHTSIERAITRSVSRHVIRYCIHFVLPSDHITSLSLFPISASLIMSLASAEVPMMQPPFVLLGTYTSSRTLFENGEWIWADSAYALDEWCRNSVQETSFEPS